MIHAAEVLYEGYAEVLRENFFYLVGIVGIILWAHVAFFFIRMEAEYRRFNLCLKMGWDVGELSAVPEWAIASCMGLIIAVTGTYPIYCLWVAFWEHCYPYLVFHGLPLPLPFSLFSS